MDWTLELVMVPVGVDRAKAFYIDQAGFRPPRRPQRRRRLPRRAAHPARVGLRDRDHGGEWRLFPTRANRMPTAASYRRRRGDPEFRAFKFDVLRIVDGRVAEITTFGAELFPAFGLPPTL